MRKIKFHQAILEATDQCMAKDPSVYIMGLGVPDPKGVFGTTLGLQRKYGAKRAMDMPVSENAMTGVAIGSAIVGLRPIITHQRVDFLLLALEQIINNAAKWHYMFGKQMRVPLVIRVVVGRGWGQGPQHSQSLHSLFAHIPGLKVVLPSTPYDAKGLLVSAIEDDNPVIYMEQRWLHNTFGEVPEELYRVPLGKAKVIKEGKDATVVSTSHMTIESLRAASILANEGIDIEVVDVRSLAPLDRETILASISKTGRLIMVDGDWKTLGFGSEIVALAAEHCLKDLKAPPLRVSWPDCPLPSSRALANHYYPRAIHIINSVYEVLDLPKKTERHLGISYDIPLDVPDRSFTGPF